MMTDKTNTDNKIFRLESWKFEKEYSGYIVHGKVYNNPRFHKWTQNTYFPCHQPGKRFSAGIPS